MGGECFEKWNNYGDFEYLFQVHQPQLFSSSFLVPYFFFFQLSGKVQVFVYLFTFFHFPSVFCWNWKINPMTLFFVLFWEFFTPASADGFSLEFEWQQVSSSLQDSSQYSGRCLLFTPLKFFTSVLPDGFSLQFEWQQVSSSLLDSSQDSGRPQQCCRLDSLYPSANFQVFQAF